MRWPASSIKILLLLERSAGSGHISSPRGGRTVKRVTILLMVVAIVMVIGSGVALAKTIRCDGGNCFGTNRADSIFGTNRHDAIFARRGADFVTGRGGRDNLNGQDGNDRLFGGIGPQRHTGGRQDEGPHHLRRPQQEPHFLQPAYRPLPQLPLLTTDPANEQSRGIDGFGHRLEALPRFRVRRLGRFALIGYVPANGVDTPSFGPATARAGSFAASPSFHCRFGYAECFSDRVAA